MCIRVAKETYGGIDSKTQEAEAANGIGAQQTGVIESNQDLTRIRFYVRAMDLLTRKESIQVFVQIWELVGTKDLESDESIRTDEGFVTIIDETKINEISGNLNLLTFQNNEELYRYASDRVKQALLEGENAPIGP